MLIFMYIDEMHNNFGLMQDFIDMGYMIDMINPTMV